MIQATQHPQDWATGMSGEPVGVVGLGKVGLCVALTLERGGRKVVGVEAAAARAQAIAARTLVSDEPQVSARLAEARGIEIAPDIATMVGAMAGTLKHTPEGLPVACSCRRRRLARAPASWHRGALPGPGAPCPARRAPCCV